MSWKSGSDIMSLIISNVKDKMDPEDRESFYKEMIEYFEDNDCDTLYECLEDDPSFDKAFNETSFFKLEEDSDWDDQGHSENF